MTRFKGYATPADPAICDTRAMIRDWLHRHPLIGFFALVFGIN
jgi:hypothetical protein